MQNTGRKTELTVSASKIILPATSSPWVRTWLVLLSGGGPGVQLKEIEGGRDSDRVCLMLASPFAAVQVFQGAGIKSTGNFILNSQYDTMELVKVSSSPDVWAELNRSNNT